MDQTKRDPQDRDQQQRDQRQMNQERDRDMGKDRNEEETGKPVQLDKDDKEGKEGYGQPHQGGQHHQGGEQGKPDTERRPNQGQQTGQR